MREPRVPVVGAAGALEVAEPEADAVPLGLELPETESLAEPAEALPAVRLRELWVRLIVSSARMEHSPNTKTDSQTDKQQQRRSAKPYPQLLPALPASTLSSIIPLLVQSSSTSTARHGRGRSNMALIELVVIRVGY